jgi:hypothetical protein
LKSKEYCLLNKQYPKEEREKLTIRAIKELQEAGKRGEFFDPDMSPFPYNDTVAYEYFPIQTLIIDGKESVLNPQGQGSVTILQPEKFLSPAILNLG